MSTVDNNLLMLLYERRLGEFHRELSTITKVNCPTNEGMRRLLRIITQKHCCERFLQLITMEHLSTASFYDLYYINFADGSNERRYVNAGFCVQLIQEIIDFSNPTQRNVSTERHSNKLMDERYLMRCLMLFTDVLPPKSIWNRFGKNWIERGFKSLGLSHVLFLP